MLASCGPAVEEETSGGSSESGAMPSPCEAEPDSDACRDAFAMECADLTDEASCTSGSFVPVLQGAAYTCAWLEPRRVSLDGTMCTFSDEAPRCVAGFNVGEGGIGCEPHWDPAAGGQGVVIASSGSCTGPYDWEPCTSDDAPPECACAFR
jgi:hypothetical protein